MKQKEQKVDLEALGLPDWMVDTFDNRVFVRHVINNEKDNIKRDVDGFYYWFPSGNGSWATNGLKVLTWIIDKLNEPYEKQLEEYFKEQHTPKNFK